MKNNMYQNEKYPLSNIRKVEYKHVAKRYGKIEAKQMKEDNEYEQQNIDPDKEIKAQMDNSLMKFEDESHMNLSDSEKQTSVTQTTDYEDLQNKNFRQNQSQLDEKITQNDRNKQGGLKGFEFGISEMKQYQQSQLKNREDNFSKQYQINENQMKKDLLISSKKKANIFSDQSQLQKQQQIFNETNQTGNQISLTQIHMIDLNTDKEHEQKFTKSQGSIQESFLLNNQLLDNQLKPSSKSYLDHNKQVQYNKNSLNDPSPQILPNKYKYQSQQSKESIPFSNASKNQSVQNKSNIKSLSFYNSLNSTLVSKKDISQCEDYNVNKVDMGQQYPDTYDKQINSFSNNSSEVFNLKNQQNIFEISSNQINYEENQLKLNQDLTDLHFKEETHNTQTNEQNIDIQQLILTSDMSDESHQQEEDRKDYFKNASDQIIINNNQDDADKQQEIPNESNHLDEDDELGIVIIPTQTVETEESEFNKNIKQEIKTNHFNEMTKMRNYKKDHLLNESNQFKNNEGKQTNIIISDQTLSPDKQQNGESQGSQQSSIQSQSKFSNLRKRIQRSAKNIELQNQNNSDELNKRQVFEGNIQLIYTSYDSFADFQNKNSSINNSSNYNNNQQQDLDQNLEIDEEIKKNKINISDFQNQNYKKIALDLKKNLSGSKQQQFEQIEKKDIQDQTVFDNSFSDDSPLSFPQSKQQSVEFKNAPTLYFQNVNSKKQSTKKISLQQFQTQIMSDSNESESDKEQNDCDLNQENEEIQPQKQDQKQQNNDEQHNDAGDLGLIYFSALSQDPRQIDQSDQNSVTLPKLEFKYQKESNLIVFSNHLIEFNDKVQTNDHAQDDFNNFETDHNLVLSNYYKKEDNIDPKLREIIEQHLSKNNSEEVCDKEQNSSDKNFTLITSQSKSKSEKPNILQFETEEEQENSNINSNSQSKKEFYKNSSNTPTPDGNSHKKREDEIVTQFSIEIPSKKARMQRIKAFSQNNTPLNSKKCNTFGQNDQYRNSAEQTAEKFKGRPSNFLTRLQQYKEQAFNKEYDIITENSQQIQTHQTTEIPHFAIDSPEQHQTNTEKSITNSSGEKISNQKYELENQQDRLFTQSADDIEDFYEEEDEEDDELDEEEDEIEQDNNLNVFQEMHERSQNLQKQECFHKRSQEQCRQTEQTKINQREIGIGKYFYEKMCNVYGDTKLFQKKKRNLKKWLKMIQQAESSLSRKSQDNQNYEYLQINEKLKLSTNQLSMLNNQNETSKNIEQEFNNYSQAIQPKKEFVVDNLEDQKIKTNEIDLLKRKIFQQKLLEQSKYAFSPLSLNNKHLQEQDQNNQQKINSQESEQFAKQLANHDALTAEEEFQLIYEFKKIKKNEFLKALKKGPPMWYRWSAWKAALDLNVEEYRITYEKLKPSEPLDFNKTYTNPIDRQINKDVTRTIPDEPFFSDPIYSQKSLQSLRNVLKAVSLYYDNVGYCQGMNFLAAFLLLINGGDELQAFSMFIQMEKRLNIMGLFEEGFPLIQFMNFVFQREFGRKFPKLFRHFNKLKIPETMWVVQWFQTIFLNSLSLNVVCRFWDYILCQGSIISAISISLSLIHEYNAHLIKKNELDEISQFIQKLKQCSVQKGELRNSPCKPKPLLSPFINFLQKDPINLEENIVIDPEKIIKRAQQYELNKKDIISYINEFKQINFLYKDKPFLKKMEEAINIENQEEMNTKSQNTFSSTPKTSAQQRQNKLATQQTSKSQKSQVKSPELQSLLHRHHHGGQLENKKNLFSILGFNSQKKNQNNM